MPSLLEDRSQPAALYAVRGAPECGLIGSDRGLIRLVSEPVKIKLMYDAWRRRLKLLAKKEREAIRSSHACPGR